MKNAFKEIKNYTRQSLSANYVHSSLTYAIDWLGLTCCRTLARGGLTDRRSLAVCTYAAETWDSIRPRTPVAHDQTLTTHTHSPATQSTRDQRVKWLIERCIVTLLTDFTLGCPIFRCRFYRLPYFPLPIFPKLLPKFLLHFLLVADFSVAQISVALFTANQTLP